MNKSPRTLKLIEVDGESVFTTKNVKCATESLNLCDYCANSQPFEKFEKCWVYDEVSIKGFVKLGIKQEISYCIMHQPVIGFMPPLSGFESNFNTVRPGSSWHSRLRKGAIIGLLDVKKNELFGKAQVVDVDKGNIINMLDKHAHANHLMRQYTSGQDKKLLKLLIRIYGPRIINDDSVVSVINLRRV